MDTLYLSDKIENYFLKLAHYEEFENMFVKYPHIDRKKILKDWIMNYLNHLYEIECDRVMLKFHIAEENVEKAMEILPSLSRIGELIIFWENIQLAQRKQYYLIKMNQDKRYIEKYNVISKEF